MADSHAEKLRGTNSLSSIRLTNRVSLVHVALTVYSYIRDEIWPLHDPSSNASDDSRESSKSRFQSRTSSVRSRARTRCSRIRTISAPNDWYKARSRSGSRLVDRRSISRGWRSGCISQSSARRSWSRSRWTGRGTSRSLLVGRVIRRSQEPVAQSTIAGVVRALTVRSTTRLKVSANTNTQIRICPALCSVGALF